MGEGEETEPVLQIKEDFLEEAIEPAPEKLSTTWYQGRDPTNRGGKTEKHMGLVRRVDIY